MMQAVGLMSGTFLLFMLLSTLKEMYKRPIKFIFAFLLRIVLALVVLCVINLVGENFMYHLPINFFSVLLLASLKMWGLGALVLLNFLIL